MGCGTSESESSQQFDQYSQAEVAPATGEELRQRNLLTGLGEEQRTAILDEIRRMRSQSPYELDPATRDIINQQFDADLQLQNLQNKEYADWMSGGRGLRMSDTPIAEQAIQRQGLGLANLLGQYGNIRLNAGLMGNQYRTNATLGLSQITPSSLLSTYQPLWQERMAQAKQHQWGTGKTRGTQDMSTLAQVQSGVNSFKTFGEGLNEYGEFFGKAFGGGMGG